MLVPVEQADLRRHRRDQDKVVGAEVGIELPALRHQRAREHRADHRHLAELPTVLRRRQAAQQLSARGQLIVFDGERLVGGDVERDNDVGAAFQLAHHPDRDVVDQAAIDDGEWWTAASEEVELLDEIGRSVDRKSFLAGESTPVFFGSALTNFGVRFLLDGVVDLVPPPAPRLLADGSRRPLDAPFSGMVFKVQAGMDKAHRDRLAFVRVCSGRFERGMVAIAGRTGRQFSTKYAQTVFGQERGTVEEAYPGDVLGLVNANDLRVGDAIYIDGSGASVPKSPNIAPPSSLKRPSLTL